MQFIVVTVHSWLHVIVHVFLSFLSSSLTIATVLGDWACDNIMQ